MADDVATTNEDHITQSTGNDTLTVSDNSQFQVNDFFDGGDGHDVIIVNNSSNVSVDLTTAHSGSDLQQWVWGPTNGFHNYEGITFGPDGGGLLLDDALNFGPGLLPHDLAVTGGAGPETIVVQGAGNLSVADWTFTNWNTGSARDFVVLFAGDNADTMTGSSAHDEFFGFKGKDTMTGGLDADLFQFTSKLDSLKGANRDVITDFSGVQGGTGEFDLIDLNRIDAKKGPHNQDFKWIGAHNFHHKAGELQVKYHPDTDIAIVSADINGDGRADFQIEVHSTAALVKADFIL